MDGTGGVVLQLDEFIAAVRAAGRMIHDLVDDDRADDRRGVRSAGAGAELCDACGIIHAEAARRRRNKVNALTRDDAAK